MNKLLVVYDDAQCAQLVSTFCQFFVDKMRRIRDNISAALQSSGCVDDVISAHEPGLLDVTACHSWVAAHTQPWAWL